MGQNRTRCQKTIKTKVAGIPKLKDFKNFEWPSFCNGARYQKIYRIKVVGIITRTPKHFESSSYCKIEKFSKMLNGGYFITAQDIKKIFKPNVVGIITEIPKCFESSSYSKIEYVKTFKNFEWPPFCNGARYQKIPRLKAL